MTYNERVFVMGNKKSVQIVTAVILNNENYVALVRKTNTHYFIQPGGKYNPGEDDITALRREIREELGCDIAGTPTKLGSCSAEAANEPNTLVNAVVYYVKITGCPIPSAEIAEIIWLDPFKEYDLNIAQLTSVSILPIIRSKLLGHII